jgi:glutathione S-transferase
MSLTLHFHPLPSYCWKTLIALYENDTPFTPHLVNLGDEASRAAFLKLWPIGKFPVLRDDARHETVPESSIIIEYLAQYYPGRVALVPADEEEARRTRFADRFYDLYVHTPMQTIVGDRLRPADAKDPFGVAHAKGRLATAYDMIEDDMADRTWAAGERFSMADCAAMPALFYAQKVLPLGGEHKATAAYFERLMQRPSVKRTVEEATPYFSMFPQE